MSNATGQPSTNTLSKVIDLLVEQTIRLDALEHALKGANPLVHELYLGNIEKLQAQKAADLKRGIAVRLKSRRGEGQE
jgi:hypothetical protein